MQPWKASGAPLNWGWFIAVNLTAASRLAVKSLITLKRSIIASAPIARWATIRLLTSNSKTINYMTRFYCPSYRSKPTERRRQQGGAALHKQRQDQNCQQR